MKRWPMEPGAPLQDAGIAPAEDEEEDPDFDGDYQKSLRHSWEFAAVAQVAIADLVGDKTGSAVKQMYDFRLASASDCCVLPNTVLQAVLQRTKA